MPIAPGSRLGPYEVTALLGAGGMGEVYKARDTRLDRTVAIKILPAHLSANPEVRARFEREARAISHLSHPHICALFDVGSATPMGPAVPQAAGGTTVDYLVMEYLEGETLAARLEKGPLPLPEVLRYGIEIASALDRAHRSGIVHRDLKPANVMLTTGGAARPGAPQAKLMDFGLARPTLLTPGAVAPTDSPTVSRPLTGEGTIVGTLQYMAPEQLEGKEADARTDLWALGCVLYEMASGKRAFAGTSQASLIAAILKEAPRPLPELQPLTPPALERLVKRCLEKDPDERFQSARDLAFDLEGVAVTGAVAAPSVGTAHRVGRRFLATAILGVALAAGVFAAGFFLARRLPSRPPSPPTFTRLTFQRGRLGNARFSPDGESVLYSAAWDGHPPEVFEARTDLSTTRPLGLPAFHVHAVSHKGELALGKATGNLAYGQEHGSLALAPPSGSAPRTLLEDISGADWAPDGTTLAVVRHTRGEDRLEMPPGHVLASTSGWFSNIRVSPDGRRIAFAEHTVLSDTRGGVAVADTAGRKATLTKEYVSLQGIAWSPDGREIWFSAAATGVNHGLLAVTPQGQLRTVAQFPTSVILHDVARDGRILFASQRAQTGIRGSSSADNKERELGWLDFPWPRALSTDGRTLLLDDQGETAGPHYAIHIRGMDGSSPQRLGEGAGCALSPDGRWALAVHYGPPPRLVLIPTGAGDTFSLPRGQVETYQDSGSFLPDGRSMVFVGAEHGRPQRTWVQEVPGGTPRPVTPEGTVGVTTSPDGRWVAAVSRDSALVLFPLLGGEPRSVTQLVPGEKINQWSADGRTLFASGWGNRLDVFAIDAQTGKRRLWRTFEVPDPAGVSVGDLIMTRDARSYAYAYMRYLDELYLAESLK